MSPRRPCRALRASVFWNGALPPEPAPTAAALPLPPAAGVTIFRTKDEKTKFKIRTSRVSLGSAAPACRPRRGERQSWTACAPLSRSCPSCSACLPHLTVLAVPVHPHSPQQARGDVPEDRAPRPRRDEGPRCAQVRMSAQVVVLWALVGPGRALNSVFTGERCRR